MTADGALRVIDVDSGSIVASRCEIHPMPVSPYGTQFSAAISAAIVAVELRNGGGAPGTSMHHLLATGGKDGMVRVWRLGCEETGVACGVDRDDIGGLLQLEPSMRDDDGDGNAHGDHAMSLAWITNDSRNDGAAHEFGAAHGNIGRLMLACGTEAGVIRVFDVGRYRTLRKLGLEK